MPRRWNHPASQPCYSASRLSRCARVSLDKLPSFGQRLVRTVGRISTKTGSSRPATWVPSSSRASWIRRTRLSPSEANSPESATIMTNHTGSPDGINTVAVLQAVGTVALTVVTETGEERSASVAGTERYAARSVLAMTTLRLSNCCREIRPWFICSPSSCRVPKRRHLILPIEKH